MKQLSLFALPPKECGGEIRQGKRKLARTIFLKKPLHLVFRSERAKGEWSFLYRENPVKIHGLLQELAARYGIRVYEFSNVGNHLHLMVQTRARRDLQSFLRVFPLKIIALVTGAKKGKPIGKFFDKTVFSRPVEWGRDYQNMKFYLIKNSLEGAGVRRAIVEEFQSSEKVILEPFSFRSQRRGNAILRA